MVSSLRQELHWGRLIACRTERPRTVDDMLRSSFAASPDALAIVDGDTRLTYAGLDARADAVAAGLAARGVNKGDRVAVMLANGVDAIVSIVAIIRLGAVVVPIGTRQRGPEIAWIFEDAEPVAIIHGAAFAAELPLDGPAACLRFDVAGDDWAALAAPSNTRPSPTPMDEEDVLGILYTSGTTGRPKGAMVTHLGVVHSCLHWQHALGLRRGERTMLCVPWSHVTGLCGVVLPFLHLGGTLVSMAEFKRREFLVLAARERITHALMVPAMYGLCLLEADLADFDLGSWRIGAYGGAPMPEPIMARFAGTFPQLRMCNCYGATETTSPATIMPPGDGASRPGSIGYTVSCGDIRVMSDAGHELGAEEEGELWIAGPMVVPGYWRNPAANATAFAGGYWKSGDIGAVDVEGYVRIADRKKDMINRGGFKVYPAEVESVLAGIAGVVEAAVVGQPDAMLGEYVVAFVTVTDPAPTGAQLRDWCAGNMADYKVPALVVIDREPLPRNANGKIQKELLRARASALPPLPARPAATA